MEEAIERAPALGDQLDHHVKDVAARRLRVRVANRVSQKIEHAGDDQRAGASSLKRAAEDLYKKNAHFCVPRARQ